VEEEAQRKKPQDCASQPERHSSVEVETVSVCVTVCVACCCCRIYSTFCGFFLRSFFLLDEEADVVFSSFQV
jgi:hypothetical protein